MYLEKKNGIMKFLEILKKNVSSIVNTAFAIAGTIFTLLSIFLSFITWEELGITAVFIKLSIFLAVIVVALVGGILWICVLKRKSTLWDDGDSKVNVCYADIMKKGFPKKKKDNKIIVIPVNTCFDTIVDDDLSLYNKPLVSSRTVHGSWINHMIENGFQVEEIDEAIKSYFLLKGIEPVKELTPAEKGRGKKECYENGTIAIVKGNNNVEFFLLALSEFDENNKAQGSKEIVIKSLKSLLEFYDSNGQGYPMYITLMGTGRSRAGLTHYDSLQIIKSVCLLYKERIHGTINIVIYGKDKDKVTI